MIEIEDMHQTILKLVLSGAYTAAGDKASLALNVLDKTVTGASAAGIYS